jgi:hypothetical protein
MVRKADERDIDGIGNKHDTQETDKCWKKIKKRKKIGEDEERYK